MANFEFTPVQRGELGSTLQMPDDILRVTKKTMSFNDSVSKLFNATRYKTAAGEERIKLSIGYDLYNQAIQIKSAGDGFAARVTENGHVNVILPTKFRKAGLPVGDYKLVKGERDVFQLARE